MRRARFFYFRCNNYRRNNLYLTFSVLVRRWILYFILYFIRNCSNVLARGERILISKNFAPKNVYDFLKKIIM